MKIAYLTQEFDVEPTRTVRVSFPDSSPGNSRGSLASAALFTKQGMHTWHSVCMSTLTT